MSYTASALKILSRRYRLVLLKCALLNAGLLLTTSPASADALTDLKNEIARPTGNYFTVGNIETSESLGTVGSNGGARIVRLQNGTITATGSGFGGIIVPLGSHRYLTLDHVTMTGFSEYDVNNGSDTLSLFGATLNKGVIGSGTVTVGGREVSTVASIVQSEVYISTGSTLNVGTLTAGYVTNKGTLNLTGGTLTANVSNSGKTQISGEVTVNSYLNQDVNITSTGNLTIGAEKLKKDATHDSMTVTNEGGGNLTLTGSDNASAPAVAYTDIVNYSNIKTTGHVKISGNADGVGGIMMLDATDADASLTLSGKWNTNTIQATGGNTASLIISDTSALNNRGALNIPTTINAKMITNADLFGAAVTNNGTLELTGGTTTQTITNNNTLMVTGTVSLNNLAGTNGSVNNSGKLILTGESNTNRIGGTGMLVIDSPNLTTTSTLDQPITVNAGKKLTTAASLIGDVITNNGTVVLNSGILSSSITGGTTQIPAGQEVTAYAYLMNTYIDNYGVLNTDFMDLFGDEPNDLYITNRADAELRVKGDGALTRTINGDGKTYLNGNIIWDDGSVSLGDTILQSGSMTVEAIADVQGELRMNGKLTMELYEVSANFSGYAGGKLVVHETFTVSPNTTLELVVDSDTMRVGESTGNLVLIDAAGYAGDFAELAPNNRYTITRTGNGTYRLKYDKTAAAIAKSIGANIDEAEAWDKVDPRRASTPAAAVIAEKLNHLSQYDRAGYGKALKNLAPTTSSTVSSVSSGVMSMIDSAVSTRVNTISGMPPATSPDSSLKGQSGGNAFSDQGIWGQLLYNYSEQKKSSKTAGFKGDTVGAVFGIDSQISDDVTLGFGYAYSKTDVDSAGKSIDVEGHTLFGYAQYLLDGWLFKGSLSYGIAKYDEKVSVAGIGIKSDYDVSTAALSAIIGYDFDEGIIPEGGFRANRISRDSYKDTSGQRIAKDNMNSLTLVAGSRFVMDFGEGALKWSALANAALTYDLIAENATSVVSVNDSVYYVKGRRLNRLGAEAGLGAQISYTNWDFSLNYGYIFKHDFQSHTVTLKAEYNF